MENYIRPSSGWGYEAVLNSICASLDDGNEGLVRKFSKSCSKKFKNIQKSIDRNARFLGTKIDKGLEAIHLGFVAKAVKWACTGNGGKLNVGGFVTKFFIGTSIKSMLIRQAAIVGLEAVSAWMETGVISSSAKTVAIFQREFVLRVSTTVAYIASAKAIGVAQLWTGKDMKEYQKSTIMDDAFDESRRSINELITTVCKCTETMGGLAILAIGSALVGLYSQSEQTWANWSLPIYPDFSASWIPSIDIISPVYAGIAATGLCALTFFMSFRIRRQVDMSHVIPKIPKTVNLQNLAKRFENVIKAAACNGFMEEFNILAEGPNIAARKILLKKIAVLTASYYIQGRGSELNQDLPNLDLDGHKRGSITDVHNMYRTQKWEKEKLD